MPRKTSAKSPRTGPSKRRILNGPDNAAGTRESSGDGGGGGIGSSGEGMGDIRGALIGGLFLGFAEVLSKAYISSQMGDAVSF